MNKKESQAIAQTAAKNIKSAPLLYAQGMTTREIITTVNEMNDADVSAALISKVTDAVLEPVIEWQSRPLDAVDPIAYL